MLRHVNNEGKYSDITCSAYGDLVEGEGMEGGNGVARGLAEGRKEEGGGKARGGEVEGKRAGEDVAGGTVAEGAEGGSEEARGGEGVGRV